MWGHTRTFKAFLFLPQLLCVAVLGAVITYQTLMLPCGMEAQPVEKRILTLSLQI